MIEPEKRKAIYFLYLEGMSLREIGRRLSLSRHTVRAIIVQKGMLPEAMRKDKKAIEPELLQELHHECDGWVQRVHEKLREERGIDLGYSTLTRLIREHGLGKRSGHGASMSGISPVKRCSTIPRPTVSLSEIRKSWWWPAFYTSVIARCGI